MITIQFNWKTYVVAGVILLLLFFLFKGCYHAPDHKDDKAAVDSIAMLKKSYDASQKVIMLLTKANDSLSQELMQVRTEKAHTEIELNKSIATASGYLNDYKTVKRKIDTAFVNSHPDLSSLLTIQDSLNGTIENAAIVIARYRQVNDQIDSICQQQQNLMDQKAIVQADLIARLKQDNDIVIGKYNTLYADYKKVNRRNKGNQVLTKILAGVALAATTLYLTK